MYGHTAFYPFIKWDDYFYILDNDLIKGGWGNIFYKVFTSFPQGNYFPFQLLSYALEWRLFGANPAFYHIDNVTLHIFNAFFSYTVFFKLVGDRKAAFLGALFFIIHPVHVESVAWASERKDVLYLFFLMLSFIFYLRFAESAGVYNILLSYFFYISSLLSKSTGVVFPVLILITAVYFNKPFDIKKTIKIIILFFVASFVAVTLQIYGCITCEAMGDKQPVLKIAEIFIRYAIHLFYPIGLSPHYGLTNDMPIAVIILFFSLILVLGWNNRLARWAVLWFFVSLLPVLNILPIQILMADRYLYLPALPIYLFVSRCVIGLFTELRNSIFKQRICAGCVFIVLVCLSVLALSHTKSFSSTEYMWKKAYMADKTDYAPAINLLRMEYRKKYSLDNSLMYTREALNARPLEAELLMYISNLYFMDGDAMKVSQYLEKALSIPSSGKKFPEMYVQLARAYSALGSFQKESALIDYLDRNNIFPEKAIKSLKKDLSFRLSLLPNAELELLNDYLSENFFNIITALQSFGYLDVCGVILKKARDKFNINPELCFFIGVNELLLNNKQSALDYFRKSVFSNKKYYRDLSKLIISGGSLSEYKCAIINYPENEIIALEAVIYYATNENNPYEAKYLFEKTIEKKPYINFTPRAKYFRSLIRNSKIAD